MLVLFLHRHRQPLSISVGPDQIDLRMLDGELRFPGGPDGQENHSHASVEWCKVCIRVCFMVYHASFALNTEHRM